MQADAERARTSTRPPATANGASSAPLMRPATSSAVAPASSPSPASTSRNSSPPWRASRSPGRTTVWRRSLRRSSSSSPAPWPSRSLTALKSSRSRKSSATRSPVRAARSRTRRRCSCRRARLARPVERVAVGQRVEVVLGQAPLGDVEWTPTSARPRAAPRRVTGRPRSRRTSRPCGSCRSSTFAGRASRSAAESFATAAGSVSGPWRTGGWGRAPPPRRSPSCARSPRWRRRWGGLARPTRSRCRSWPRRGRRRAGLQVFAVPGGHGLGHRNGRPGIERPPRRAVRATNRRPDLALRGSARSAAWPVAGSRPGSDATARSS